MVGMKDVIAEAEVFVSIMALVDSNAVSEALQGKGGGDKRKQIELVVSQCCHEAGEETRAGNSMGDDRFSEAISSDCALFWGEKSCRVRVVGKDKPAGIGEWSSFGLRAHQSYMTHMARRTVAEPLIMNSQLNALWSVFLDLNIR
jgi:hypothetical protein